MKYCKACDTTKERSEFHKNKQSKDRLHYYCKECRKVINKAYRHTDEFRARSNAYKKAYTSTPEGKARMKKWNRTKYLKMIAKKEGEKNADKSN